MITLGQFKTMQFALATLVAAALLSGCHTSRHGATYYSSTTYPASYGTAGGSSDQAGMSTSDSSTARNEYASNSGANEQSGDSTVIPLFREEVRVGKRTVDAGAVQLRKTVRTETVNEPVQIRRESVTVERESGGNGSQSTAQSGQNQSGQNLSQPFQEGQTEIRLQREEPVVETRIVPAGRIVARKTADVQQTNIQSQVRRDDINVSKSGDAQNVNISPEVTAMGGANEPGGQSQGSASSSGMITDINRLSTADANSLDGQSVRLSTVQVQQPLGDRLFVLQAQGRPVYVRLSQPQQLRAGETVTISGTVKRAGASSGLSEQDQQTLQGQPFYIEAQRIERDRQ
jgi:stress response protein YsnF